MTKRIIAYISFGLGFLIITFFKKYTGTIIPYPIVFYLLGFALFIIGIVLIRKTPTLKEQRDTKILNNEIKNLILSGEKIKIKLSDCTIKENNYVEEVDKYGSGNYLTTLDIERNIQAVNSILSNIGNAEKIHVFQTVLIYTVDINGKIIKFSSRILPYDRINLLFKLDKQKETILYVDKKNREMYYFDLDFLNI